MSDLETLRSPPSSGAAVFDEHDGLKQFSARLERLRAKFHHADEAYARAVERCYTPEFNVHLERYSVRDDEQSALRVQREREAANANVFSRPTFP